MGAVSDPATTTLALVVEDNDDDLDLLQIALRKAGLEQFCRFVHDGEEAVAYMRGDEPFTDRTAYPFPNILVLDFKLPKMDGLGVLEWMREIPACKDVRVIVLSGCGQPELMDKLRITGASLILEKGLWQESVETLIGIIGNH